MFWPTVYALSLNYQLPAEVDNFIISKDNFVAAETVNKTQVRGMLYIPDNLKNRSKLLIFSHGNHQVCDHKNGEKDGDPEELTDWEDCDKRGFVEVRSDMGFDYLANHFNAQGYSVLVPSFNKNINGNDFIKYDPIARANMIVKTLKLMDTKLSASVGRNLTTLIDRNEIILMGHSRGGESCRAFANIVSKELPNAKLRGVFEIAPTDFGNIKDGKKAFLEPMNVPWAAMVGSCDGDVVHFDGLRVFDRDTQFEKKVGITVVGANHNFFNTRWLYDDGDENYNCKSRLKDANGTTSALQKQIAISYLDSFVKSAFSGQSTDLRNVKPPQNTTVLIAAKTGPSKVMYDGLSKIEVDKASSMSLTDYFSQRLSDNLDTYKDIASESLKMEIDSIKYDTQESFNQSAKALVFSPKSFVKIPLSKVESVSAMEIEYGQRDFCYKKDCKTIPLDFKMRLISKNGTMSVEKDLASFGMLSSDENDLFPYFVNEYDMGKDIPTFNARDKKRKDFVKFMSTLPPSLGPRKADLIVSYQRVMMKTIQVPFRAFNTNSSDISAMYLTLESNVENATMILGKIYGV